MNVFVLSEDPRECARFHADQHVGKMLMESVQLLFAACPGETPWRKTHLNHPCAVWVRESRENWRWLLALASALAAEHARRFGTVHGAAFQLPWLRDREPDLPPVGRTPFAQAVPEAFRSESALSAYRAYYSADKRTLAGRPASWTRRPVPEWFR